MEQRHVACLAALCLAAVLGCSERDDDATAATAEPVKTRQADTTAEREAKERWRAPGSTQVDPIDWASADDRPRVDVSALPERSRLELDSISLPVLLPRDPALLRAAVLTGGPTWYGASLHADGLHITIHGTNKSVHRPGLAKELAREQPEAGKPRLSRTHGIVSLSFEAFGASYTLDVECKSPRSDPRCTGADYARSLFEDLGVAGRRQ